MASNQWSNEAFIMSRSSSETISNVRNVVKKAAFGSLSKLNTL